MIVKDINVVDQQGLGMGGKNAKAKGRARAIKSGGARDMRNEEKARESMCVKGKAKGPIDNIWEKGEADRWEEAGGQEKMCYDN